jgi:hypothetical protein
MTVAATVTATSSAQAQPPKADAVVEKPKVDPVPDPLASAPAPEPSKAPEPKKVEATKEPAKVEAEKPKADPAKPEAAAEVTYDLKLGEGSLLDPEGDVKAVLDFAKENKIAPEVAGKILEQREAAVKSYDQHQRAQVAKAVEFWKTELPSDPEIGGDKLPGVLEDNKRLLNDLADKELIDAINQLGFGNNKFFNRFLYRLSKNRKDDQIVTGKTVAADKSAEDIMFPLDELNRTNPGMEQQ